jgi:hypothetical protein
VARDIPGGEAVLVEREAHRATSVPADAVRLLLFSFPKREISPDRREGAA